MADKRSHKQPVSVLVVIHSPAPQYDILLLERAAHPGYWQSVTGSREGDEALIDTAVREVAEETGIVVATERFIDWQQTNTYEIFPEWRHRYAPGVTQNTEHVFSLEVSHDTPIRVAPGEHLGHCWLPLDAAAAKVFSWSNRDAILALPRLKKRS